MALQMAFKALNDSVGPNGLVPTLLVFGAYPQMVDLDAPLPIVVQRSIALRKAMEEIKKLRAECQVSNALNSRNGPHVDAIHDLPINSPILVWREGNIGKSGHWSGLYTLIAIKGESCVIDLPYGPTTFHSTSVKPYYTGNTEEATNDREEEESEEEA